MSVSFSGHAETCGMQTMGPADPGCSDFVTHPGHRCCSDVVVVIQGHDALAAALAWHLVPFVGMAAPVADLGFWIPERPVDRIPAHDGHSPPFPEKDIYKIYEAYLI